VLIFQHTRDREAPVLLSVLMSLVAAAASPSIPVRAIPMTLTDLELDLTLNYSTQALGGRATLRLQNRSRVPVSRIPVLLGRLMLVSRVSSTAGDAIPFVQRVARFEDDSARQVDAIEVRPRHPIAPGDSVTLIIQYGGILVGYTETGSLYIRDRIAPDFTILRTDAFAFPSLGSLSAEANRAIPDDPFAFAVSITVPDGEVVATGGIAEAPVHRDSLVTWRYHSVAPVPFLNVTIAPYQVIDRGTARIFHFSPDSAGAEQVGAAVTRALTRYADWFGPLAAPPALTIMEIPEGWGSQASLTGGIIQTADAFADRAELRQVYHELSHLWNVPDLERPSPRWNEGLASFLQWRMAEELDGGTTVDSQVERTARRLLARCVAGAPCASLPMSDYGRGAATDLSYPVGMLLFDLLYQVMGPARFDRAYAAFYRQHRTSGATAADLASAFGELDPRSRRLFSDWMNSTRWYEQLRAAGSVRALARSAATAPP
jgi:hypothetical protein